MKSEHRIKLEDPIIDVIIEMCNGNPGAVKVCVDIFSLGAKIDPLAGLMASLGPILDMDEAGIYGEKIWLLAKDVCQGRIDNVILLFRAIQLGLEKTENLIAAIEQRDRGAFDFESLAVKVRADIKTFNWPYEPE